MSGLRVCCLLTGSAGGGSCREESRAEHPSSTAAPPVWLCLVCSMDWHKELERTVHTVHSLSSAPPDSLYEGHSVPTGQHFGSSLPSILQRQTGERSPWVPGYRAAHQWPQMWGHAQVWGDPTFRPFFPDPSQDLQAPAGGFRSGWEPPHDVKTIENVLNCVGDQQGLASPSQSQGSYHSPDHSQGEADRQRDFSYEHSSRPGSDVATFEHPAYSTSTAPNYIESPNSPANLTVKTDQSQHNEDTDRANTDELSQEENQDLPKDLTCDRQPEDYPRDYSASYERREDREDKRTEDHTESEHEEHGKDIIKNMTEKYGGEDKEIPLVIRKSHLGKKSILIYCILINLQVFFLFLLGNLLYKKIFFLLLNQI